MLNKNVWINAVSLTPIFANLVYNGFKIFQKRQQNQQKPEKNI